MTRRPRPTRRNAFRPKTALGPILAGTRRGGNNSLEGEPVVQPVVEPRRGKALACTGQNLAGDMFAKIPDVGFDDGLPLLLIGRSDLRSSLVAIIAVRACTINHSLRGTLDASQ